MASDVGEVGPGAVGDRRPFATLPAPVVDRVAGIVGGRLDAVRDVRFGFSPGVAAAVRGPGGAVFVKAVHAEANPDSPGIHRREAEVLRLLAGSGVRAPHLEALLEVDGWTALVTDVVAGAQPALPWTATGVDALLGALDQAHHADGRLLGVAPAVDALAGMFGGWAAITADERGEQLSAATTARLDDLVAIEAGWPGTVAGDALLHCDARGDNLLVDDDGTGTLVDWPWATHGHPLVDVVLVAPSVAMQGGPAPAELLGRVTTRADTDRVRTLAVATAGMFRAWSLLPPPPGLPTLRPFQAAQADAAERWAHSLLG